MGSKEFLDTVGRFIVTNRLMDREKLYLTALSGGADSVALALTLKLLGYRIEAVHCNFRLRGAESDRDEDFCTLFCKQREIPLHITHFDTAEYAKLHKISIEMAARKLRYAYFRQLLADMGGEAVCVGHHMEDSVETLLLNLIRGTGINGMTGIAAKNGDVVRPLLNVTRGDIEDFLKEKGQDFVTDSSNLVDDVKRNKIRLNLMPVARTLNPSADKDIAATARRLAEAAKVFNRAMEDAVNNVAYIDEEICAIDIERLFETVSPECTLYTILSRYSFSPATTENIYAKLQDSKQSGKVFTSATHQLLIDRNSIFIEKIGTGKFDGMKIPECGIYTEDGIFWCSVSKKDATDDKFHISKDCCTATLDARNIQFPLTIRYARQGDWFIPFGMKGRKSVSDFLTDRKINLFFKKRQLVVEDAAGNIVWIVGERTDNRFRVSENTTEALVLSLEE